MTRFEKDLMEMKIYVLWIAVVENDSDKKAGFLGRGRLVILIEEKRNRSHVKKIFDLSYFGGLLSNLTRSSGLLLIGIT